MEVHKYIKVRYIQEKYIHKHRIELQGTLVSLGQDKTYTKVMLTEREQAIQK